jgi:hypothetical protein
MMDRKKSLALVELIKTFTPGDLLRALDLL